jgi:hypothetical protein
MRSLLLFIFYFSFAPFELSLVSLSFLVYRHFHLLVSFVLPYFVLDGICQVEALRSAVAKGIDASAVGANLQACFNLGVPPSTDLERAQVRP